MNYIKLNNYYKSFLLPTLEEIYVKNSMRHEDYEETINIDKQNRNYIKN